MENSEQPRIVTVALAYKAAIAAISRLLAALVGLWASGLIVGWFIERRYFDAIGADWLIHRVDQQQLLAAAGVPILLMGIGVLWSYAHFGEKRSSKETGRIAVYWIIAFAVFAGLSMFTASKGLLGVSVILLDIAVYCAAYIFGWVFGATFMIVHKNNQVWDASDVFALLGTLLAFFFLSTIASDLAGQRDADVQHSQLPFLETKDGRRARLLLMNDESAYAMELLDDKHPVVIVLAHDQIRWISENDIPPSAEADERPLQQQASPETDK